jgi:hypothetical protein
VEGERENGRKDEVEGRVRGREKRTSGKERDTDIR